ncbi:hypothetical protein V2L60_08970 [Staphylococcus gallinarum]
MLELILLLCSSGVAGLFTYIYLDYLAIFDTEKPEIKKMFSVLFSLISVGIFTILNYLLNQVINDNLISIMVSILITVFLLIFILNKYIYIFLIKTFRLKMNQQRKKSGKTPYVYNNVVDHLLEDEAYYYVEKYSYNTDKCILKGWLSKHETNISLDYIFAIQNSYIPTKEELESANSINILDKSDNNTFYIIYKFK